MQGGPGWTIPFGMSTSDSFVARTGRVDRAPETREAPAEAPRSLTSRLAVCLECEAFVAGTDAATARRDPERREIERGVARLSVPGRRTTLRPAGVRLGHASTPCACCRRPGAGARVVLERTVADELDEIG